MSKLSIVESFTVTTIIMFIITVFSIELNVFSNDINMALIYVFTAVASSTAMLLFANAIYHRVAQSERKRMIIILFGSMENYKLATKNHR